MNKIITDHFLEIKRILQNTEELIVNTDKISRFLRKKISTKI